MKQQNKILFIHISDIHLTPNSSCPPVIVEGIANAVGEAHDFSASFIVFTGDIANSGSFDEYSVAQKMTDALFKSLHAKGFNPKLLLIPGNHDIQIPPERNYASVKELIGKSSRNSALSTDLCNMNPFFDFANKYDLFSESRIQCSVSSSVGPNSKNIEFTLLNTAPFSTREADDKELHYLPDDALFELRKKSGTWLKIVLMHHNSDWFESNSKLALENYLSENCDMLFVGHEHDSYVEQRVYNPRYGTLTIRGGELNDNEFGANSFSTVVLDCNAPSLNVAQFIWNRHPGMFVERSRQEIPLNPKVPEIMEPNHEYLDQLNSRIELLAAPVEDIFVFPEFRIDIGSEEGEGAISIHNEEDFWETINRSRLVCVVGGQLSGKTTLLKHLYRQCFRHEYSPLFLGKENAGQTPKHLIDALIREQYGDDEITRNRYAQMPRKRKILFIDDFDALKAQYSSLDFLQRLLNDVQCIVYTSRRVPDDNIIDRVKASLGSKDHIVVLSLKDFYKTKRKCLIDRVCASSGATCEQSDEIIAIIDRTVHSHRRLSDLSPDFIIRSTAYYLDRGFDDRAEEAPFDVIFEANITKSLEAAYKNNREKPVEQLVRESLVFLGAIAFRMHEKRKTTLATEEIRTIVDDYCADHLLNVNYKTLFDALQESGLLVIDQATAEWGFTSENYLAYFVAKWLHLQISVNKDVRKVISKLVSGICFDINESILLFLSYLRNDTRFPLDLCTAADDAIGESESLSFDKGTISFLALPKKSVRIHMADERSKEEVDLATAQMEEELGDEQIMYRGAYEYADEEALSTPNRIVRAVKCLKMVGKSLVSQNELIEATTKALIIDALYEVPNKILFTMLHAVDEQYGEVIEFVTKQIEDDPTIGNCEAEEVREQLSLICLTICLSLYDSVAFCASNKGTAYLFQHEDEDDTNMRIQKLSMMSHALDPEAFINYSIGMMEKARKTNNLIEVSSIRLIVNHYLYQHRGVPNSLLQKCAKKVFNESDYSRRILKNRDLRFE